jgi:hypothetical protein
MKIKDTSFFSRVFRKKFNANKYASFTTSGILKRCEFDSGPGISKIQTSSDKH